MQTTIVAGGLRAFDGDLDRFIIFSLIVRESLGNADRSAAISTYSLALSLGRPFETVRRHVNALIVAGHAMRIPRGVTVAAAAWTVPAIAALMTLTHDSFVRFVEDSLPHLGDAPRRGPIAYSHGVGVQAAADLMLTALDSNRQIHGGWIDLVLFSTVLHTNMLRLHAGRAAGSTGALTADHAVRASVIARALAISETTVRRRLADMAGPGRPLRRVREGLMISIEWLDSPAAIDTSLRTYSGIRRIVARAAAQGFPIDAPAQAYIAGRPPIWEAR
ncbi:hypothetical protein [Sphingomonas sp.]|uniref:hypothetical protein n=1 Tax=Sphingomonas sp. TaxID=28214 RepID=UPI002DD6328F|nr:hypothetical protein [Sphingomonas sp.]